jgi:hypothetical protein
MKKNVKESGTGSGERVSENENGGASAPSSRLLGLRERGMEEGFNEWLVRCLHSATTATFCFAAIFFCGCHHQPEGKAAAYQSPAWVPAPIKTADAKLLRQAQLEQLKTFCAAKEQQAVTLAKGANVEVSPEAHKYFDAAKSGDWKTVEKMFADFAQRSPQYANNSHDESLRTIYWSTILEVDLAYECVIPMDPKTLQTAVDDVINSIPPGSIYFGGTDPGRGLITAFTKSQVDGDPFFTLTQNALADGTYLDYLRAMYGTKIQIPSKDDSQKCFDDYKADAQRRLQHDQRAPAEPKQIKSGENVRPDGVISGQIAVMSINGLIAKDIFDRNPDRDFYIEESFPLDWMYPHLEPHGLILKIDREPLEEMPESVTGADREYWQGRMADMVGNWLNEDTPVKTVADFVDKVYVQKDLSGFTGSKEFLESQNSQKFMSKLRSSIAGVYAWRFQHARTSAERDRMQTEADLAFRQAVALCPSSPEAVFRYVSFLMEAKRQDDAVLIASACLKADPKNHQVQSLLMQLQRK